MRRRSSQSSAGELLSPNTCNLNEKNTPSNVNKKHFGFRPPNKSCFNRMPWLRILILYVLPFLSLLFIGIAIYVYFNEYSSVNYASVSVSKVEKENANQKQTQSHSSIWKSLYETEYIKAAAKFGEIKKYLTIEDNTEHRIGGSSETVNQLFEEFVFDFCFSELHDFQFTNSAQQTLKIHLQFYMNAIFDKDLLPELNAKTTIITMDGTIIDLESKSTSTMEYRQKWLQYKQQRKPRGSINKHDRRKVEITDELLIAENHEYGQCLALQVLINEAKSLNLANPMIDSLQFALNEQIIWDDFERKYLLDGEIDSDTNMNTHLTILIQMIRNGGQLLHRAEQLLPKLLQKYCPNVFLMFKKVQKQSSSKLKQHFISSSIDILHRLRSGGNVFIQKNEIAVVDYYGSIVAIHKFSLDMFENAEGNDYQQLYGESMLVRNEDYATCPFIEKLILYPFMDNLDKQISILMHNLLSNDLYAFENKMDLLMEEHCSSIVRLLQKTQMHENGENIYRSIFRGELLSFSSAIAHKDIGLEYGSYFITVEGGIIHEDVVDDTKYETNGKPMILKCKVIDALSVMIEKRATVKQENNPNGHRFEPNYDDSEFESYLVEIQKQPPNIRRDNEVLFRYIVTNDTYHFRRMLVVALSIHHKKYFVNMTNVMKMGIISDIEHFVPILLKHDFGFREWPSDLSAVIDVSNGNLIIAHSNNSDVDGEIEEQKDGKILVHSLLLKRLFMLCVIIENKNRVDITLGANEDEIDSDSKAVKVEKEIAVENKIEQSELEVYVDLIWNDIRSSDGKIDEDGIFKDLYHFCDASMQRLSEDNQLRLKVNLVQSLTSIAVSVESKITNPVIIIEDGGIISLKDVADNDPLPQFVLCPFITHLLNSQHS